LNYTVKAAHKNRMAVANYLGEPSIRSDLSQYLSQYRPEAVSAAEDFKLISIDNGTTQQVLTPEDVDAGTGIEGALDVQSMLGIAWPTPLISYSTGGSQPGFKPDNFTPENTNEPYLAWVQHLLSTPDDELPYVISTSYADNEQTVSPEYAKRVCESFAQLGARGVSLFFASGDDGVGADGTCFANEEPYERKFMPEFPSSCPYVTTVGGTFLFEPEVAVVDTSYRRPFYSSGGFSEYFPTPSYQKTAVSQYLASHDNFPAYSGLFTPTGRAYPDVAAQSLNFSVIYNSGLERIGGTSAATPAFAAIVALVNDALLAAGRPTMGFLNPWLYRGGFEAFRDVLSGKSAGCETEGFPASKGWDAVTGWGTPDFLGILETLGLDEKRGHGDGGDRL
jgi:tripeptidyl-peptidase-1